jgi:hypothetical protein
VIHSITEFAAEPVKVKEIFDVKLKAVDAKAKIKVIKEIRTITGLGLKEVSILRILPDGTPRSFLLRMLYIMLGKGIS